MRREHIDLRDTVRLVDSRYDDTGTDSTEHALDALAGRNASALADLVDLVQLTSARAIAERGDSADFPRNVLVAGVPLAAVINAAFTHPAGSGRGGGRFNDERVGAWYAGEEPATARAEVEYHRRPFLLDAGIAAAALSFTPYLADVNADAVVLNALRDRRLLDPDSYVQSQAFGQQCRNDQVGVIRYPSVRAAGGCVAVLVPNLVQHVRRGAAVAVTWTDGVFTWS
jgi:RES domain-containing protein